MALKFRSTNVFLKPDVSFKSRLVSKFINYIMVQGKKSVAERTFYEAMAICHEREPDVEPLELFEKAVDNVRPSVEVRSKRIGGATYQVPTPVRSDRQTALAFRWILTATRGRKGRPFPQRLADELIDAYKRQGTAITQKENTHKMADANKAFAHFAR
ncbi:MAG TPA: 30S ribosomal protein S7 [Candidatus Brocadiia bacterium]|nr:30S ribosomal protein S7 [Candidatus Brocadiia bacterium]